MPSSSIIARPSALSLPQGLPPVELDHFRTLLLRRRAELVGDISALLRDAFSVEAIHVTANQSAEGGSDTDLQDTSLGLADEDKQTLRLIDRALAKLDGGLAMTYGLCEYTHQQIARERLELMPWTPLSIEGATYLEEHFLDLEDLLSEES